MLNIPHIGKICLCEKEKFSDCEFIHHKDNYRYDFTRSLNAKPFRPTNVDACDVVCDNYVTIIDGECTCSDVCMPNGRKNAPKEDKTNEKSCYNTCGPKFTFDGTSCKCIQSEYMHHFNVYEIKREDNVTDHLQSKSLTKKNKNILHIRHETHEQNCLLFCIQRSSVPQFMAYDEVNGVCACSNDVYYTNETSYGNIAEQTQAVSHCATACKQNFHVKASCGLQYVQ